MSRFLDAGAVGTNGVTLVVDGLAHVCRKVGTNVGTGSEIVLEFSVKVCGVNFPVHYVVVLEPDLSLWGPFPLALDSITKASDYLYLPGVDDTFGSILFEATGSCVDLKACTFDICCELRGQLRYHRRLLRTWGGLSYFWKMSLSRSFMASALAQ